MSFDQFIRILRARWKLALGIFVLAVVGTAIASMAFPKKYKASTTVIVDGSKPDPLSIQGTVGVASNMNFLSTQIDVIESRAVAMRVVRALHIADTPSLKASWLKETNGSGDYEAWVADLMSKGLSVKPSRESNVVEITYEGADPGFAASMANAFAQSYIDMTVQFRVDPARQYATFFEERGKLARAKLEQAQQALAEAQKAKGIIVTEERLDVEMARLNDLSQQVLLLRSNRAEAGNRSAESLRDPGASPDVVTNQLISTLKAEQAQSETKLAELLDKFGDQHPDVIQERSNLARIKELVQKETANVSRSLHMASNISVGRESEVNAAYEAQRERVLKLKEARSELSVLEREVDGAQRVYDAIMTRLSQTSLESSSSQAGVTILSPATPPTSPSSPRVFLNTALSALVGFLLALIASLSVELLDRRVRSAEDLTQLLGVNVLGALPSPNEKSVKRLLFFSGSGKRAALT